MKNMNKKTDWSIFFIRFTYLLGAILDFLVASSMTLYIFFQINIGLDFPDPTTELRFVLVAGMTLMWGWTVLLVWGFFKPIERRLILFFTAVPVVLGYFLGELVVFVQGYSSQSVQTFAVISSIRGVLIIIFITAYFLTIRIKNQRVSEQRVS
jgi:hypothetical protein